MEWEKEGAESWALPHYGPTPVQIPATLKSRPQTTESEDEDSAVENTPTNFKGGLFKRSIPTGPHTGEIPNRLQPTDNQPHAGDQYLDDQQTPPLQPGGWFKPGQYGSRKEKNASLPEQQLRPRPANTGLTKKGGPPGPRVPFSRNDSFAKSKWRKGSVADASFRLPAEHRVFQEKYAQTHEGKNSNLNLCDLIMQQTGAYVRISVKSAKMIDIWGKDTEVLAAQKMAQHLVDEVAQSSQADRHLAWHKIHAHSMTKIATEKFKENVDARLEELRNPPKVPTGSIKLQLLFLWPENGPSLTHCLATRRQLLNEMRKTYDVNIYTKPGIENVIFLAGDNEAALYDILNTIREIWEGLFVQCETEVKLFLVDPPEMSIMKSNITVQHLEEGEKAFLYGTRLTQDQAAHWFSRAQILKQDNKDVISRHLGKALQVMPHFNGLLQMRAKFGSFFLQEYRKPPTGATYSFEEFRDMLRLENVEGRLLPGIRLPTNEMFRRIMAAKNLLVPQVSTGLDEMMKIVPKHSASFDYRVGGDSIIRVEFDFALSYGSGEFETNGIRCFKPRKAGTQPDRRKPLQVGMIDFERSDWQFEVKALTLFEGGPYSAELEHFKRTLHYDWNTGVQSIGSNPVRKARFPPGAPIPRFVEKSAIRLGVIGTPYVFELCRFDEYVCVNRQWSKKARVSWGATIFNPEWDAILAEQVKGNAQDLPQGVAAFFPASAQAIAKAKEGMEEEVAKEKDEEIRKQAEAEELGVFMSKVLSLARILGSAGSDMGEILDTDVGTLF